MWLGVPMDHEIGHFVVKVLLLWPSIVRSSLYGESALALYLSTGKTFSLSKFHQNFAKQQPWIKEQNLRFSESSNSHCWIA